MSIIGLGIIVVIGLGFLPIALDTWRRLSPKTRLVVILVAALAFMLMACDDSGIEGTPWRLLRTLG